MGIFGGFFKISILAGLCELRGFGELVGVSVGGNGFGVPSR